MSTSGVEDEEILEVLRSADGPRLTTTEVAEELPITRGRTRTRLQRLVDDERLNRETVGNEVVWWLPERDDEVGDEAADDDETDEEPEATGERDQESEAPDATDEEPEATDETDAPAASAEDAAGAEGADGDAASVEAPEVDEAAEPVAPEAEATGEGGEGASQPDEAAGGTGDDGPAEIEVEAVGDQVKSRGSVTDVDEEPPTRPTADADEEAGNGDRRGLRVLGLLAAAAVVVALLRRLLGGGEDR